MQVESNFRADVKSRTSDYGIMQINKINHKWLSETLEITDFLDEKQNIKAGIYMLSTIKQRCNDTAYMINAYNMGHRRAINLYNKGITEGVYLDKVVTAMENLEIKK